MSDRGDGRQRGVKVTKNRPAAAGSRPGTKNRSPVREARREAVRKAAAERAAALRRKRLIIGGIAALVVIALAVIAVVAWPDAKPAAKATAQSAALKTKPTVGAGTGDLTTLKVTTLIKGTGPAVKSGQNLTVNYVGVSYKDGKEFDSSWKRSEPFEFVVGQGGVIKGWDQGLIGVTVGSRVQLDIPSALAYGDDGNPPGALRFVVDVLSAK